MTEEEARAFLNDFYRTVRTMRYWQKMFYATPRGDSNKGYYCSQSQVFEHRTDELIQSIEDKLNHNSQQ